ncbi:MAG: hypothetical protein V1862_06645 [Methanobacteriota archaeon]
MIWLTRYIGMRLLICMSLVITVVVLTAGCSQMQANTSSDALSSKQIPTQTDSSSPDDVIEQYPAPPEDIAVSAQINDKDITDKTVSVFFSGGRGQKMVKSSWVIITRSDGTTERVSLPPRVQSEVILQGSDGEDLIRVYANYLDGNTYLIGEKQVRMRQRV